MELIASIFNTLGLGVNGVVSSTIAIVSNIKNVVGTQFDVIVLQDDTNAMVIKLTNGV